jgi:hypothetical protein
MINTEIFDRERELIFVQTLGGVYLPMIGIVYWPTLGVLGYFLSPQLWFFAALGLAGAFIPVTFVLFKRLKKRPASKSPLSSLVLPALIPVLMSFAITLPVYYADISLIPLSIVLGLALHWPVIGWLYNQPVYIIHALVRTVIAVSIWFFMPQHLFTLLPISVGILYLVTTWWLLRQLQQLKMTLPVSN